MRRALLFLLAGLTLVACGGGGSDEPLSFHTGGPPWAVKSPQADYIDAAGLPKLTREGDKVHYHAHLDVVVDGETVVVPTDVGVDTANRVISPLHTHDDLGTLHVEAEDDEKVTLGQFLTQWGVKVTPSCVASHCGDEVAVYVGGVKQTGAASNHVITADTNIALVLGTPPAVIPGA